MTEVPPSAWVSQYVSRENGAPNLRDRPRPGMDDDGLSVVTGDTSPGEACYLVRQHKKRFNPDETDGVRAAQVADLVNAGFEVHATPTSRNARHASVRYPGLWDDHVARMFNACFGGVRWHGEQEEEADDDADQA